DLDDLDCDRVAAAHDVVDLVDPLAAAELGDVDQSVDALLELDKGAEVGRLDHLAGDDVADLDVLAHRDDALGDRLACLHVGGGDVDRAVVFDVDLHAELLAEPLDGLAALADDEADLVEDEEPAETGLLEGVAQDLEAHARDLDVHLQGGDAVARARHLEVHVAEVVLDAGDVGEHDVVVTLLDQPHGDAGYRLLDLHAGVHEREGGAADAGHGRGTVALEDLGHQTDGVGE